MRRNFSFKILDPFGTNNMTGTSTIFSMAIETYPYDTNQLSFEVQVTGTPTGTLTFEGSNQYDPKNNPGISFITISAATLLNPAVPAVAGAPFNPSYMATALKPASFTWVRWKYINASGSGQLSIWAFGKGRN
jgi:hypothetical protein